jgi:hypothetical protein
VIFHPWLVSLVVLLCPSFEVDRAKLTSDSSIGIGMERERHPKVGPGSFIVRDGPHQTWSYHFNVVWIPFNIRCLSVGSMARIGIEFGKLKVPVLELSA